MSRRIRKVVGMVMSGKPALSRRSGLLLIASLLLSQGGLVRAAQSDGAQFPEANQCVAAFDTGLQTHGENGRIDFGFDAQLLGDSSSILNTHKVDLPRVSRNPSCGSGDCSASGTSAPQLEPGDFKVSGGSDKIKVKTRKTLTLPADGPSEYRRVDAQPFSHLIFSPKPEYRIKTLTAKLGSTLELSAGDYWIDTLELRNIAAIKVRGEGTARLFVRNPLNIKWSQNYKNRDPAPVDQAHQLLIYSYSDIRLKANTAVPGYLYAKDKIELLNRAEIHGGASAANLKLRMGSRVYRSDEALSKVDFSFICDIDGDSIYDGFDEDIDGDGINNNYEIEVGTNPYDPADVPPDMDSDGIPDSLDADRDGDSVDNELDAFPDDPAEWSDLDSDGIGDNSDPDRDGDGISNDYEEQLGFDASDPNSTPADLDGDAIPDALDNDIDGDGFANDQDAFPRDPTEWADLDGDGIGNNSDPDRDGDGIDNTYETELGFDPDDAASTPPDQDGDGMPDALDNDIDGDGVLNSLDAFPRDPTEWSDLDGDGIGDNSDPDRDGDGITNGDEEQLGFDPNDATSTPPDLDKDGQPDALDTDIDGDGVENEQDAFPYDPTESSDLDGDGIGDNSDLDRDGDGISNAYEEQLGFDPNDPAQAPADLDGDGIPDPLDDDIDGDGVTNDRDAFPRDPTETADLDGDGIGDNSDPDRDGDGISNAYEEQLGVDPNDPAQVPADLDSDGIPDALDDDIDGDGVANDQDAFPRDPSESADLDGDGVGDNSDPDRDGDGISNDYEEQLGFDPNDPAQVPADLDGDATPDALDDDIDGDGVNNDQDAFPEDATETADLDGDGIGDNSDPDRDGDGISNAYEEQLGFDPNDPAQVPADLDGDAIPDALDNDIDGDGVTNDQDAFPGDATETADLDGDGIGDNSDPDRDGDGSSNEDELQAGTDPDDPASFPDTTAPELSLIGPSEQSTEESTMVLSGNVSDEHSGVATLYATSSSYEGVEFSITREDTLWQAQIPLELGSNVITIVAIDEAGNSASTTVLVERLQGNASLGLIIDSPAANTVFTQPDIVVRGTLISEEPVDNPPVTVNGLAAQVTRTADPTRFRFESPVITLAEGTNFVHVAATVNDNSIRRSLAVVYQVEAPEAPEPSINVRSPLPNRYLTDTSFVLSGSAQSYYGNLNLSINGLPVQLRDGDSTQGRFEELMSFDAGQSEMAVLIEATDELGQVTAQTVRYYRDVTPPEVLMDASIMPAPVENPVQETPYWLSGTIIERNLSGFFVNGQQVGLEPLGDPGQYRFATAVNVGSGTATPVSLEARDLGGNSWRNEYLLLRESSVNLELLLPADKANYLSDGSNIAVKVSARLTGGQGTETAKASIEGDGVSVVQPLTVAGGYATGDLEIPGQAGDYRVQVSVYAADNSLVARTTRTIQVTSEQVTPLTVLAIEPEDQATAVEPNGFITIFFDREVPLEEVSVEVRENANGLSYVDQDPPGVDSLFAKGYRLEQVNRSYEAVPGTLSILPDGKSFTYYPDRDYAYNAEVFVSVNVNGEEKARTRFNVRPLPTFVEGGVLDQLGQPVAGIRVEVPELGLSTTTTEDGAFAFGYGASAERNIPSGRFRLQVNQGLQNRQFGSLSSWINLQAGTRNYVGRQLLPTLNKNIAFSYLQSGREIAINGNEVVLDTTSARLQFPDRRSDGEAHVQFTPIGSIPYAFMDLYVPPWMYSVQPAGIRVEGNLQMSFALPAYQGSHDYAPGENEKVLLMGLDPDSQLIRPFGVGEMRNLRIHSLGNTAFDVLDMVGYARVLPDQQGLLTDVAEGRVSLGELYTRLQSYRLKNPNELQ